MSITFTYQLLLLSECCEMCLGNSLELHRSDVILMKFCDTLGGHFHRSRAKFTMSITFTYPLLLLSECYEMYLGISLHRGNEIQ